MTVCKLAIMMALSTRIIRDYEVDTVEQISGYFYKGYWNLNPEELFLLILIDAMSQHLEIEATAATAILTGQPWIPTRTKPGTAIKGTSIASIMSRKLLSNVRLPVGISLITPMGKSLKDFHWSKTNKLGAVIGRYIPWIGWAMAFYYARAILIDTGETFNKMVKPEHKVAWTYF
ncbi:cytoplasmic protein [Klebsiella aerogenes]|nr:cytoplasmic protein [Klebsiella aerogenes]